MSNLTEYFFNRSPAVFRLQMVEIDHSAFLDGPFRLCPTVMGGITVTHEDTVVANYQYVPMEIKTMGSTGNLDQDLEITLGDLGEILPAQIGFVRNANKMREKPSLIYREYASNALSAPMFGPFTMQVNGISFNKTGATFTAKPVAFNRSRTGEVYDLTRFPMLAGFV